MNDAVDRHSPEVQYNVKFSVHMNDAVDRHSPEVQYNVKFYAHMNDADSSEVCFPVVPCKL
jgi:hypothetical protein